MTCNAPRYVLFSGNVGAGKSTLARLFSERVGFTCVEESVDRLIFVNEFFNNMPRWAFHHQADFLLLKGEQERWIMQSNDSGICQDRSLDECFEVFTRQFHEDGWISAQEWLFLTRLRELVSEGIRSPDLCVFVTAPVPVLLKRIFRRARKHEANVAAAWLERLEDSYERWIAQLKVPVIHIDTGKHDIVDHIEHREAILESLTSALDHV